ncbi:MAG: hypothetical protein K2X35_12670 [Bryobacteraceae bacterium]|nr:hypothetical protein [Bryobacteraceae bacterium]
MNHTLPLRLATLAIGGLLAVSSLAAADPDFSGEWTINFEKSNFGPAQKPDSWTRTVKQQGNKLYLKSSQPRDSGTSEATFEIGGPEVKFSGDIQGKGSVKRDGAKLIFTSTIESGHGGTVQRTETWVLSPDGRTLTAEIQITAAMHGGGVKISTVWNRK